MKRNLTNSDIKEIKHQTRMGYILSFLIFLIVGLFGVFLFFNYDSKIGTFDNQYITIFYIILTAISIAISFLINRKYFKDLKNGDKIIKTEKVYKKENRMSYEAGSGNLYIPILGFLFPKTWSQEMKPHFLVYLIINNYRYKVDKTLFDNVKEGDYVKMHYSTYSNTLLRIE